MNGWREARNILVVRLDNIGDVIMLGPALRAVKQATPEARLTLLASPAGAGAAPLLPWIDDVIVWRSVWQDAHGRVPFEPARERDLIERLTSRRFDAALIFTSFSQTPHAPGYVCYLAGIPLRAGESKEFGGGVLTTELRGAPDEMQQAERNLRLVEALGFPAANRRLAVALRPDDREAAALLLADIGFDSLQPFVVIHPGASATARRYPPERFGEVAQLLRHRGLQVLLTGVEREAEIVNAAARRAPGVPCLLGQTTLAQYAALIERASLVICGNTLPLHLADALGTPLVVLYSGTDYEEQWRPRFVPAELLRRPTDCHPCYLFDCPLGQPCLDIPATEVVAAAEGLLARTARPCPAPQMAGDGDD
jgi:ADP-heptose:LPS heptosyltransferase